jgi:hypothetical protein
VSGSNLICSFTRENSYADAKYFNLNKNDPYLIAAYGRISGGGFKLKLFFHFYYFLILV